MIISFFLSLADNKYRDRVRDRFSGEKGKGRVCRWLVRREDEVSLVLEQWGMTRASGSVHVLLPVTRRLIDSQPSCSVNVVYRVSSRSRCRVCRRLGESRRRLRSTSTKRSTKSRKIRRYARASRGKF